MCTNLARVVGVLLLVLVDGPLLRFGRGGSAVHFLLHGGLLERVSAVVIREAGYYGST